MGLVSLLRVLTFCFCCYLSLGVLFVVAQESSPESPGEPTAPAATAPDSAAAGGADDFPVEPPPVEPPPVEIPEGYQEELQARVDLFRSKRLELEKAIGDQREIYIRYLNLEEFSPERRKAYFEQRNKVRDLLDETYKAALSILQIGFDQESGTFVATLVQHRHELDIYDQPTLEGAARLIDGGSNLKYLFEAAARSAVVSGEFEIAKKIYDAIKGENREEVDKLLEFNLERYQEQFQAEAVVRELEIREDRLPRVLLKTTQGDVVLELFLDQAPSTVSNFIRLVEEGFYDGLDFYQVIDHLLALTGDPTGSGAGNSGKYLRDEHTRPDARPGLRGSLVMAKLPMTGGQQGESFIPNSASSQFAILLLPILSASEEQTIFGTVIEGMDVVSRLRRVDPHKEKKKGEVQYPPDSIIEAKVIRRPDSLPEPEYVGP